MQEPLDEQYAREVLGLKSFRAARGATQSTAAIPLLVECEAPDESSRALLHKILGSIGLNNWAQIKPGEAVADPVRFRLRFLGEKPWGRRPVEGGAEWSLPKITDMAGPGAQVVEIKKACWTALQSFKQEWGKS